MGNLAERGVRAGLGAECGGRMGDWVSILQYLSISSLILILQARLQIKVTFKIK
jgi:hypothetical protein